MPEIHLLRSRLLEQSLLLCGTEEPDLQLESLRRIIFTAQSIIEQLSIVSGEGDDLEKIHENPVKLTNSSHARRVPSVGIGHLPVEILRHIFHDYHDKHMTVHLSCLMRVSRQWRDIISNDPHLWTKIHIVPNGFLSNIEWYDDHIKRCLGRSRGSPLDVTVDLSRVEEIPDHLKRALGTLVPSMYLGFSDYLNWDFEDGDDGIKQMYIARFLDILRLLVGLPAASAFVEMFSPEPDEQEMEDVGVVLPTNDVLGGCQSFRLTVPSFFGTEFLSDIWPLLEGWTESLKHLSIEVDDYEEYGAVIWPQYKKCRFDALHRLSFNFPVDLDSVPCNPVTLRDLTVHVDSFGTLGRFTSLERITLPYYRGGMLARHPPPLSLPRLRYLTVDSYVLEFYSLDFDLPSLHRLSIIFHSGLDTIEFRLLPSVTDLDLAVDRWLEKSPRHYLDGLNRIFHLLEQCTMLENLRLWEHVEDAEGTVLMQHILSAMVDGQMKGPQNLRHVTFVRPKSGSKDMDDGFEVFSYDVQVAVQNLQQK